MRSRRHLLSGFMLAALVLPAAYCARPAIAVTLSSSCQVQGQIAGAISSIFADYPSGGPAMVDAIASAVLQNPEYGQDVVAAARNASSGALDSAADGLASAHVLLRQGDPGAAERINDFIRCADSRMQAAFSYARTVRAVSLPFGLELGAKGGGGNGSGGIVSVSPSRP